MEEQPNPKIRGLHKFADGREESPPVEVRGLEKFDKVTHDAGTHDATDDEDPRLPEARAKVRLLKNFARSKHAVPQEETDLPRAALNPYSGGTDRPTGEALATKSLSLFERVEIRTPEGPYVLEFYNGGRFVAFDSAGKFAGDGKTRVLATGAPLDLVRTGRSVQTGPILGIERSATEPSSSEA